MTDLTQGSRLLVTGGNGAIGAAIVEVLKDAGHSVNWTSRSGVDHWSEEQPYKVDLSSVDGRKQLAAEVMKADPPFLGLVHCAGISADALSPNLNVTKARALMDVNFWSFAELVQAMAPAMMRARHGTIVAIGSIASKRAVRGNGIYGASKAALESYAKVVAVELATKGVRVNVVEPGYIDTPMLEPYKNKRSELEQRTPQKKLGSTTDVANCVRFLFSPSVQFVTGATIAVDGGLSAWLGE